MPGRASGTPAASPTTRKPDFDDAVFYDLDRFFSQHHNDYLDGVRYEIPVAAFDVPDERLPSTIAGFASLRPPNLQGWNYTFMADRVRAALGTDTGVIGHEVGHHLGLSHVHDTYDPGLDADLSVADGGPFFFLIAGTEAYTAMSYLPNTDEFGQFDRDHMARWQVAARLDNANRILGDVARSPRSGKAASLAGQADAKAGEAVARLGQWDLPGASRAAADAYRLVLAAAAAANVEGRAVLGRRRPEPRRRRHRRRHRPPRPLPPAVARRPHRGPCPLPAVGVALLVLALLPCAAKPGRIWARYAMRISSRTSSIRQDAADAGLEEDDVAQEILAVRCRELEWHGLCSTDTQRVDVAAYLLLNPKSVER